MKFFEWVKNLGKSKKGKPAVADGSAADHEGVPGHRRKLALDSRYLKKPAPKNYWERPPKVLEAGEARRAYSPGFRNRNPKLRALGTDVELLQERGLPVWQDEMDIAVALGLAEVSTLRWLACHRYADGLTHYYQYRIPKRSGGFRTIMAPKRKLKRAQRVLLAQLISRLPVSEHAHGFRPCRSVATNAKPHVGKRVVMRFDLEDFFGTVTFSRVRGYFIAMGYDYHVATTIALLTTEAQRQPVAVDGDLRYVPIGQRACPQGAPTSPGICNAIAMRLDRRMAGLGRAHGFTYTRYADDMTFSGDDLSKIGMFMRVVREIVEDEGFRLNAKKTHIMRDSGSQKVTGVTVNEVMGLSRKERRKLRAQIHELSASSPKSEREEVLGKLEYLRMLNHEQAKALWPGWLHHK